MRRCSGGLRHWLINKLRIGLGLSGILRKHL
jgi:hypothetical protein